MAHFIPPPNAQITSQITNPMNPLAALTGIDPETMLEHAIAGALIFALVFVEDLDVFAMPSPSASWADRNKNIFLFRAMLVALVIATGVLTTSHPQLAILAALLIAAMVMVRSRTFRV